ncbi:MAG: VCBS repeat-containing protein [Nitrospirae bacterium]|nr:VCBS repeat-containing protein [Nitrospirota bacterium]
MLTLMLTLRVAVTAVVLGHLVFAFGGTGITQAAPSSSSSTADAPAKEQPKAKPIDKPKEKPKAGSSADSAVSAFSASGGAAGGAGSPLGIPVSSAHDPFSGSFGATIPIAIPPGRNGMQPTVQLIYGSGAPSSWVGVGWQLDLGTIERRARFGTDYSKEEYVLRVNGATSDLLPVSSGSADFVAKIESGFLRIKKLSYDGTSGWEVTDPRGMKSFYGRTAESRRADPANPTSRIFAWLVDRAEDPHGNFVSVTYWTDTPNNEVYLDEVKYTGFGTTDGANSVKFYRESRTDAPEMYTANYKITTAYRLKSIAVRNNGALQRAYQLTYGTPSSTTRSVLTSVQQYDRNASINTSTGAVTGTSLPGTTFTATAPPIPLTEPAQWIPYYNEYGSPNSNAPFNFVGDYNGDGKADYMFLSGGEHVALSTGTGFAPFTTWLATPINCSPGHQGCVTTGDFNADGKTDLIWNAGGGNHWVALANAAGNGFTGPHLWTSGATYNPGYQFAADMDGDGRTDWLWFANNAWYVALSKGDHFESSGQPWITGTYHNSNHQFLGDFNGDGKTDFMYLHGGGAGWAVMLSTGSSFTTPTQWIAGSWNPWCEMPGDFNGDGKTDLMWCDTVRTYVALSTGSSFIPGTEWIYGVGQYSYNINFQTVTDLNGDGKTDVVWSGGGDSNIRALISTGSAFLGPVTVVNYLWDPENPNTLDKLYVGDFTGDGRGDLMWLSVLCPGGYNCGPDGIYVSVSQSETDGNRASDLVKAITNGIGGTTTISHVPSTQFVNTQLPYAIHVVGSMSTNDGNGNVATTSYSYKDGYYHLMEREFRGFNSATVTGPTGPNGEQQISETLFHQGNDVAVDVNNPGGADGYTKGKPYRTKVTDAAGNIWAESTTEYAVDTDGAAPWFTPPKHLYASACQGTSAGSCAGAKTTHTELTYDHTYGTVTREDQHGDTSVTTDDRTITRTFSPNTTAWIVNLPVTETIYAGIGTSSANQKSQTTFYYDGTTSCGTASSTQTPTFGKLTRVVKWFSGGTNPETRMAYDPYGNQICLRDPRGNTTTTSYDSGTNTFPLTTTNAVGHVGSTTYYGVNGVAADTGLYGQGKSVTDPNTRTTTTAYDAFGRPSSTTAPNGLVKQTSYVNLGTVGSQHVYTYIANVIGGTNFKTWTYFDGLGRTIKSKGTGPQTPTAQDLVTLTEYNVRGQVKRASLLHVENGTPLWRTMTYDALGRVKTVTTPDGRTVTTCYGPWVTVVIDPKQHKKRTVVDAAGRTLTIQEYTSTYDPSQCSTAEGSPYATTTYQYDVLSSLTKVTDAAGNDTTMTYDTLSRKSAMHDPDMGNWSYVYDAAGNLIQQTDAKGQNLYFQYDALNRRRQKYFGTQKALGSGDVVYTYDGATADNLVGRLASVVDSTGNVTFRYNETGQIVRSDRTVSGVTYTTVSWYDLLGRVSTIQYPDHTSGAPSLVNYEYTGPFLNRIVDPTTSYVYAQYNNYNALGQPVSINYGNGVNTYFTYQSNTFRLQSLQTSKSSNTLQNLEYAYDNVDNVQSITDFLTSANSQTFGYDDLNRLTSSTSSAYGTLSHTYNQIGNMTSNTSLSPSTYTYPASGSSSVRPHAVSTAGSNSYTYDNNGNMLTGAGRTITYDFENRPTTIVSGGQTTTFVYDGDGGRVKKQTGSTVTWYISKLYERVGASCTNTIFSGSQRILAKPVA